ncbi:acyltransferase (plasmid) [Mesorhizobium loti]|jgi:peptidoglycan/LPS O-acetylase OafA/YrhL|uniref:Acyltransferase n=1 Tax=Mesorhizobium jarvisii TaxID=1777867 RepID=A0A6M7TRC0_9HYPH|nr:MULTISPECIES: acyltransferase [Mesorhizobium]QKC67422.1 acyltransferase [Mesorhizobium jarvisii]QKD13336.1 acyltransferase [Mesorhizobium loti]RJT29344.1 acyltransferase [Mesorhizobium jarvisii]
MLADDLNRCVKIPIPVGAMHLAGARRVSKLTTQIKRPDRFPYLSALRGMAALWVVMVHVAHMPNPHLALPWWAEGFVGNGVMGVNLFFLVSAFSLCLTMPKHDKEERPYLGFMLRRFFRIAPLFYLLIIVTRLMRIFPFRWSALAANIFFVFNFIPGSGYQTAMVLAGWTIGVEMAFYVMFPFIYARTKSVTLAIRALVVAFLVAAAFRSVIGNLVADSASYINQSIFGLAPMFMFGIIAFYMVRAAGEWKHKRVIGALLLASVPLQFYVIIHGLVPFGPAIYWQGPMFGCLLVGLYLLPLRLLVNTATVWLGNISYSIYLVHSPVIVVLAYRSTVYQHLHALGLGPVETYALALGLTLACVIPIAALTFYGWENWLNEWGKGFASRVAGRKEQTRIVVQEAA